MKVRKILFVIFLMLPGVCLSVEIVRYDFEVNSIIYTFDIELFDMKTPLTVSNFLNYVDDGDYDDSIIHRSVHDFVIQGGGFIYQPTFGNFDYQGGLKKVPVDPPIMNEFQTTNLSNIRGTIAMAKIGNDPDSATSQWFINLKDNSANLDNQNEGFTVFGRVLDSGMSIADLISGLPVYDLSSIDSAFGNLPLQAYSAGQTVMSENLVEVNSINKIQRPIIDLINGQVDFGLVSVGDTKQITFSVKNSGNADLEIGQSSIGAISAPFSLVSENCSNTTIQPLTNSCSMTIEFGPQNTGRKSVELTITPSINPHNLSIPIPISGEGAPVTPVLHIVNQLTDLNYSDVALNTTIPKNITIQNRGGGTLGFDSIVISGQDAIYFTADNGCNTSTLLALGETCTLAIELSSDTVGLKQADLNINSTAGSTTITLTGNVVGPNAVISKTTLGLGFTQLNTPVQDGFTITNTGVTDLEITSINITGADASSFTQENSCPNVNTMPADDLSKDGFCVVVVTFMPNSVGNKSALLTVNTNDLNNSHINIPLSGSIGTPAIDSVSSLTLNDAQANGLPSYKEFQIGNNGDAPLELIDINIVGQNAQAFLVASDCPGFPISSSNLTYLEIGDKCSIAVQFSPDITGTHVASLEIISNDPDDNIFVILLNGYADTDADGVKMETEENAPNSGDGNNDLLPDSIQNNVASLLSGKQQYVTYISPDGTAIRNIEIIEIPEQENVPSYISFAHKVFHYEIEASSIIQNAGVRLGVLLPKGDNSSKYYKFGPTQDNDTPHWYEFGYDGSTGAQFLGDVYIEPQGGGAPVVRSMIIIDIKDGGRGDNDLTVNGVISNTDAMGIVAEDTGTGKLSLFWIILFIGLICSRLLRFARTETINQIF